MIAKRTLILAVLSCVLAACGGGGGGGDTSGGSGTGGTGGTGGSGGTGGTGGNPPPTTPSGPTSDELSYAQNARLRMIQNSIQLSINWVDLFDNEIGYQVERRVGEGSWELVEALPAMAGGIAFWSRNVTTSAQYRVIVDLGEYSLPLQSIGGETAIFIDVAPPANPMTIEIDRAEPVSGDVQLSMRNAESALAVSYLLDLVNVAYTTAGGSFAATVPAQQLLDGQRTVLAVVQKTPGLLVYRGRQLQVDNPAPAVLLRSDPPLHAGAPLVLRAKASSDAGIASVEFFINGNSLQVVSTPDAAIGAYPGEYVLYVDAAALPAGPTVIRAVATDNSTATATMERTITFDLPPTLNVTGIFDGMVTSAGSVSIQGDFGDDVVGATLTITAGNQILLRTQASPFAAILSLAGTPAGEHSVTIRVQDQLGKLNSRSFRVIVPSQPLNYELIASDAQQLLSADQGSLLYRKRSGTIVLRNAAGVESALPPASSNFTSYRLSADRIVGWGPNQHVYVLDTSGQAIDLSQQDVFASSSAPNVRGPWVSWVPTNASYAFKVYNLQTGVLSDVPIGGNAQTFQRHDLIATAGNERLLFGGVIAGTAGIYSLNLTTNATQLLTSGMNPRTDGTRFTWTSGPDLLIAPLSNPSASTVLTSVPLQSSFEDGLACWLDPNYGLYVNDGSATTQLRSSLAGDIGYTIKNGRVVFSKNDAMYVWSAASGERLWLDTPVFALHSDGVAYFLTGNSGTLYRVTLP